MDAVYTEICTVAQVHMNGMCLLCVPCISPRQGYYHGNGSIVRGSDVTVSLQEEVFVAVGRPIIESCMGGYNGTIFA